MRIIYIPLDSRPCNARFPRQIAAMAGATLIMPDQMDNFYTPADFESLYNFLKVEAPHADRLVISIDHWCYGSLLASRSDIIDLKEALRRLNLLNDILISNPQIEVSAYSVIMRSSISTLKTQDLMYYEPMNNYSRLWYLSKRDPQKKEEMRAVRSTIPERILSQYLFVRDRNHTINKELIAWCRRGQIKRLNYLVEDSERVGFHTLEQEELLGLIGDAKNIFIHNGADEGGMSMVSTVLTEAGPRLRLKPVFVGGNESSFTAYYEDKLFKDNLASFCRGMDIVLTDDDSAHAVLIIALPQNNRQGDVKIDEPLSDGNVELIRQCINGNKPAALLDLQAMNMGDLGLLKKLGRETVNRLYSYAAWNTACNSLGTVLSHLKMLNGANKEASRRFFYERILDDGLYEAQVRQELNAELLNLGEDRYNIKDADGARLILKRLFDKALAEFDVLELSPRDVSASLPWCRTFEADIRIKH